MRVRSIMGEFKRRAILSRIDLSIAPKGVCKVVKEGKDNGAILFGDVYNFILPSTKGVLIHNGRIKGSISVPRKVKVVVRRPNFLQSCSNFRGLGLLTHLRGGVASRGVGRDVQLIKLSPRSGGGIKGFSLNVHRQLKVTRTVVRDPSVLVLSRPVGNLSGRNIRSVQGLLIRLGRRKAAVLMTDRGPLSVRVLYSRICRVSTKTVAGIRWGGGAGRKVVVWYLLAIRSCGGVFLSLAIVEEGGHYVR